MYVCGESLWTSSFQSEKEEKKKKKKKKKTFPGNPTGRGGFLSYGSFVHWASCIVNTECPGPRQIEIFSDL